MQLTRSLQDRIDNLKEMWETEDPNDLLLESLVLIHNSDHPSIGFDPPILGIVVAQLKTKRYVIVSVEEREKEMTFLVYSSGFQAADHLSNRYYTLFLRR